jgi:hypothetical protein
MPTEPIVSAVERAAAVTGPLIGASFIAGIGGGLVIADDPYPRPGSDAATIQRYFTQSARAARVSATGQLVSATALAAFTGAVAAFAGRSGRPGRGRAGRRVAGRGPARRRPDARSRALQGAAVAGGAIASASLATSGLHAAALTTRRAADPDRAVAMHRRAFLAGGPVHGLGFGFLVGALGLAGLRNGDLPRPLAIAAVADAVPNLLSPLYLVTEPAGWLIPIGRFPGLIVSGIAGVHVARSA